MNFQLTYFIVAIITLMVLLSTSCVNFNHKESPPEWEDKANPLDEPGYIEPTAKELHLENIRIITNNPVYQER